jgi:hypothetical protein
MAAQRRVAVVARHLADAVDEEPPRVAGGPNAGVWERRDPSEKAMANVDVNRQGPLHVKIRASECTRNSHAALSHGDVSSGGRGLETPEIGRRWQMIRSHIPL